MEGTRTMTHKEILRSIGSDLDDLKVREPSKYQQRERELKLFESKLGFDVATAPIGTRKMEKLK